MNEIDELYNKIMNDWSATDDDYKKFTMLVNRIFRKQMDVVMRRLILERARRK